MADENKFNAERGEFERKNLESKVLYQPSNKKESLERTEVFIRSETKRERIRNYLLGAAYFAAGVGTGWMLWEVAIRYALKNVSLNGVPF